MGDLPQPRFVKVLHNAAMHRKFKQLARDLDVSRFEAFGIVVALWLWVDENRPSGSLGTDFLPVDLADSIGLEHLDPDDLAKALVKAGLLDSDADGFHVHGWLEDDRSGGAMRRRTERARKGAHERWHQDQPSPDCELCGPELTVVTDAGGRV